jgi:hypothetical protein
VWRAAERNAKRGEKPRKVAAMNLSMVLENTMKKDPKNANARKQPSKVRKKGLKQKRL